MATTNKNSNKQQKPSPSQPSQQQKSQQQPQPQQHLLASTFSSLPSHVTHPSESLVPPPPSSSPPPPILALPISGLFLVPRFLSVSAQHILSDSIAQHAGIHTESLSDQYMHFGTPPAWLQPTIDVILKYFQGNTNQNHLQNQSQPQSQQINSNSNYNSNPNLNPHPSPSPSASPFPFPSPSASPFLAHTCNFKCLHTQHRQLHSIDKKGPNQAKSASRLTEEEKETLRSLFGDSDSDMERDSEIGIGIGIGIGIDLL